jgi:glycine cleavage system aminomethyltransferase T
VASAKPGTQVQLIVRGKPLAASVTTLPFIPTSYKKQEKRQ